MNDEDSKYLKIALSEARKAYAEGGVPVGAVLVANGEVIATGPEPAGQDENSIAHGEMNCLQNAGRRKRYNDSVLYTTLSPCMMCAGTIVQFGIKRLVVGENANFGGNEDFLRMHGVEVDIANDEQCTNLMKRFISEKPEVWDEDIAGVRIVPRRDKN